jgi:hypothetical protein
LHDAPLCIDAHAWSHWGLARPDAWTIVYSNKALEAHADPAVESARRLRTVSPTESSPPCGDQCRSYGLPEKRFHALSVNLNLDALASLNPLRHSLALAHITPPNLPMRSCMRPIMLHRGSSFF